MLLLFFSYTNSAKLRIQNEFIAVYFIGKRLQCLEAPVEESDAFLFENVNKELGRAYNRKGRKQFLS